MRIVYQSLDLYSPFNTSPQDLILTTENARILATRGGIPYIIGFILFFISMILFIKFSTRGSSKNFKFGYCFSLSSAIMLLVSIILNLITYSDRLTDYFSIILTFIISLTILNIGTMIFLKRKDFEISSIPLKPSIKKEEERKVLEILSSGEKPISNKLEPSESITKYCSQCGMKVDTDHTFCRNCGNVLTK